MKDVAEAEPDRRTASAVTVPAAPEPAGAELAGPEPTGFEAGSFRDRNGRVFYRDGRVLRRMSPRAWENWQRLKATAFFGKHVAGGGIVATTEVEPLPDGGGIVEHARVPFVSYPYEWPFGMLKAAALLHLELMADALAEGFVLKDSSPYNIQWIGARPVFIDIPSFEPLGQGEPWVGYRQFCELMLYPLMLQAYRGIDYRPLLRGRIDGITADEMRRMLSARDLLRGGVALHVVAQSLLQRRYSASSANVRGSLAAAGFDKAMIVRNVEKLTRLVRGLQPPGGKSEWSEYDRTHSYDAAQHQEKADFVARAAATRHWPLVWDLGCNTGTFSRLVAPQAGHVVSMDADAMAVDRLFARERTGTAPILPLVVNLADPSPSQGWRGLERKDLAARGRPDLVLALALVHHVVITANIPLADFLDWLAGLGSSVVIEYVGRDDAMVKALLANREDQYDDYTPESFRRLFAERFMIRDEAPLKDGARIIFFGEPKTA